MDFDGSLEYQYLLNIVNPTSGYFRILIKADVEGEYYSDAFEATSVVAQPSGIDLVRMYSLIPLACGKFKFWEAKIKEIQAMGFDCIHLLPLTEMGSSQSPYSSTNLMNVDPLYVDKQIEFEYLLKEIINIDMRLCFDLVLNHVSPESLIVKNNPDWIKPDINESDGFKRAGCWHENSWIRWEDLVLINYEHPEPKTRNNIWMKMKDYAFLWAGYASKTKGMIRLDNLHSSNEAFMNYLRIELKKEFPNLIIFAEFFADEATLIKKTLAWDLNLLLGQPWHFDFVPQLRNYFKKIHQEGFQLHHVMPINTHDTPSIQEMYSDVNYTIPRYAISSFFSCGLTGITMGVEQGEEHKMKFIGEPYNYDILKAHPFKEKIKKINEILSNEQTLRLAGNIEFIDFEHETLMVAIRRDLSTKGEDLLILVSMDKNHAQTFTINFSKVDLNYNNTRYTEIYNDSHSGYEVGNDDSIQIDQCDYRIFKKIT
jgi:glycosidase